MSDDLEQFMEEDPSSENSEDYRLSPKDFLDTFIIPSDWTVSTLRRELTDIVDLSPHFQRRSVWSKKAKSRFIESLVLGIPIPQILLAEDQNTKNKFLVLDGKQRLSAIKEFFEERFDDGTKFSLQGLNDVEEINGLTWSELKQSFPEYARALEASSIRTAVIRGWKRDDVLYEIFYRLNSGSVALSPMELRMSLIRGPFVREVILQTSEITSIQTMLGLKTSDKRMKDVEVAIRHMAFQDRRIPYRGNLKVFLDDYCKLRNENFQEGESILELSVLDEAIKSGLKSFPDKTFSRKYIGGLRRYERPFNRAIFDVLGGSLSSPEVREASEKSPGELEYMFQQACENRDFIRFIEATTKTVEATEGRFRIWYKLIHRHFGISLDMPNIF